MIPKPNIAILVLAAGSSSRMGKPKQLLSWKNTTLINHVIKETVSANPTKACVVLGANYELIKPKIGYKEVEIIFNDSWESGIGSSIAKGVQHISSHDEGIDGVLILLADQPFISTDYIQSMINKFEVDTKSIIATKYEKNKIGVPALFDNIYFEELKSLKGDEGAKKIIATNIDRVSILDGQHLINDIDTKEDYQRLSNLQ